MGSSHDFKTVGWMNGWKEEEEEEEEEEETEES